MVIPPMTLFVSVCFRGTAILFAMLLFDTVFAGEAPCLQNQLWVMLTRTPPGRLGGQCHGIAMAWPWHCHGNAFEAELRLH